MPRLKKGWSSPVKGAPDQKGLASEEQPRSVARVLSTPAGQALASMEEARICMRDRILVSPLPCIVRTMQRG